MLRNLRRLALAVAAALPAGAGGQVSEGPSFDCERAQDVVERLVCSEPALAALDRRLAGRRAEAVAAIKRGEGGPSHADLAAAREAWETRRADCGAAPDVRACVEDAYLRREAHLVARFDLEAPTGRARYRCDGAPREVTAVFHDTGPGSVRLEWGGTVETAVITQAASGARYEGADGLVFWTKGEAALLEPPDGPPRTCGLVDP